MHHIKLISKLAETNASEVDNAVKLIEQKKKKVQIISKLIKEEVDSLNHEHILLDNELKCTASSNNEIENKISILKSKTCEAASSIENIKWKMFKTNMLKVFEYQQNETTNEKRSKYGQLLDPESQSCDHHYSLNEDIDCISTLKESIKKLTEEIERKKFVGTINSKLDHDIQMLQKRNGALLKRYQRQLQEAEIRLRQMHSELNSLRSLLSEKETL